MKGPRLHQPRSLKFLFLTEFWERFAYYAVQSILILYMIHRFGYTDTQAYLVFGTLSALLFITPVIGGYVADSLIGYKHAVILGGCLLALGYLTLAIGATALFFGALAMIICGNGFLKPNISTLLGTLYRRNDQRRENGFIIFYIGINIGGMLGIVICNTIGVVWDKSAIFLVASMGLCIGIFIFYLAFHYLNWDYQHMGTQPQQCNMHPRKIKVVGLYCYTLLAIFVVSILLTHPHITDAFLLLFGVLLFSGLFAYAFHYRGIQRKRLLLCITLTVFSIAFWILYQQAPMSLTLFIDRDVNRQILGFTLPASSYWALSPIMLTLLAPFWIRIWRVLDRHHHNPSTPIKFALGTLLMSIGYVVLMFSTHLVKSHHLVSSWWIVLSYCFQASGELCVSPIGMAMVTELVPDKIRGLMMGAWFFVLAVAFAIAGEAAKLASVPHSLHNPAMIATIYHHAFTNYAVAGIAASILLAWVAPWFSRLARNPAHTS